MLSRDLVHLCDHELSNQGGEKRKQSQEGKTKRKPKKCKNTVQKEALFFPLLTTLVSLSESMQTIQITKNFQLIENC